MEGEEGTEGVGAGGGQAVTIGLAPLADRKEDLLVKEVKELGEFLARVGLPFVGQPLGQPPDWSEGVWPRGEAERGMTYIDLLKYVAGDLPRGVITFMELHNQVHSLSEGEEGLTQEMAYYQEGINQLLAGRSEDIKMEIAGHLPFAIFPEQGERQFFKIKHALLCPPAELVKKGLAEKVEPDFYFMEIVAFKKLGVDYLTLHLSTAQSFLSDEEFAEAMKGVETVVEFASVLGVTIGIETGGITEKQMRRLGELSAQKEGKLKVTWDGEHTELDGLPVSLLEWLLEKKAVGLVHLAVPVGGKHCQGQLIHLEDNDTGRNIKRMVRLLARGNLKRRKDGEREIPLMLETEPNFDNYRRLKEIMMEN